MRVLSTVLLASIVVAAPSKLESRQDCKIGFVFARGSSEMSPIGSLIGPSLQRALQSQIPGLKTFPVYYAASIATNSSPQRTDSKSIAKGVEAFKSAGGCTKIIAGGYSQGAAVMHNVVGKSLEPAIKSKVVGVALFGSTRNKQDGGHVPNFPQENSRTWCNKNDGVCGGGLSVNAGHLSYSKTQITEAATWLAARVKGGAAAAPATAAAASKAS